MQQPSIFSKQKLRKKSSALYLSHTKQQTDKISDYLVNIEEHLAA